MPQDLPPGFELDAAGTAPSVPEGFELEGSARLRQNLERERQERARRLQQNVADLSQRPVSTILGGGASALEESLQTGRPIVETYTENLPAAQMLTQGATLGFGDELMGGLAAAGTGVAGGDASQAYQQNVEGARRQLSLNRQAAPVTSAALEATGGALTAAPVATSARFQQVAASRPYAATAGLSGLEGAIYGAGESEDNRVAGAAIGGGTGLVLGPTVQGVTGLTARQAQNIFSAARNRGAQTTERRAADFARRAGIRAEDVSGLPERASGEAFLAEAAGPSARSTAIGAAGAGGQAQDIAEDAIARRAAGRGERIGGAVSDATGTPTRAYEQLFAVDELRDTARPLFNQADAEQVRVTPRIRELLQRARRIGVDFGVADQVAVAEGIPGVNLSAYADDVAELPETVNLGTLRALARTVEAEASGAFRADTGRTALGPGLAELGRQFRDVLRGTSDTYAEAASLWSGAARDEDAFGLGQRIFDGGRNAAQLERELRTFTTSGTSQSEKRMFLAGIADALEQSIGGSAQGGRPPVRIRSQRAQDRMRRFLGPEAADELIESLQREVDFGAFEGTAAREMGSATATRQEGASRYAAGSVGGVRQFAADLVENPTEALSLRGSRRKAAQLIRSGDDQTIELVARGLYGSADQQNPLVRAILREAERRGIRYRTPPQVSAGAALPFAGPEDRESQPPR